ncbi:hypothetical protein ACKUFS_13910 [Pseudomonas cannabina]|uniref:Uncharacterized protein n=2 Tax=Pseudomonas syringae group TaxID=136849 RepID=A0A3M3RLN3_PSECA|nr:MULTISPECIES: hypothetical protein [Pseudomonas syringae group]KPB76537.1 Uncharacterized protein AC507_2500 [Pseudomonas syringae pv. maculicola]KPW18501.1 Uncharacterized protein ALO83_00741 [Pseudomonas cannabina pv. alisalensis]QHE96390.1 hypothetical protein PMA4326_007030 [Pseudomonas syringae pv. maculicola str. ES4326]QQN20552.1 hypothetical protein JGS08_18270 [Pseudomonas cannabina pv. alisalensis]RMN75561.1 hypothetical protein ALQ53_03605 [Pseudomonas cannabina]
MIALGLAHLAFAWALIVLLAPLTSSLWWRCGLLAATSLLSVVSVDGLSMAAYARSLTDDLAISSLVLLGWLTLQRLGVLKPLAASPRLIMLLVFAALALTLYPATLGLTYFDPYRWGFNPRPMIIMVAVIALALICLRNALGVAMLTFATLAFTFRLKPSENYWDYLIDPLLALYCCGALLSLAVRFVYRRTTGQRRSAALSAGNV